MSFSIKSLGPVLPDLFLEYGVLAIALKKQFLLNTKEKKSIKTGTEGERNNKLYSCSQDKTRQIKTEVKIYKNKNMF